MFDDAFEKLESDDVQDILGQIKGDLDVMFHDPAEVHILSAALAFYPGYRLLEISNHLQMFGPKCHVVYSPQSWVVLDYTNGCIFELNRDVPITLSNVSVIEYIKFFFRFVKGKHGYFRVVQSVDDIAWKDDPPPQARKAIGGMIEPIELKAIGKAGEEKGVFFCEVHMMFKNALAKADIQVMPDGVVHIKNEEILIEDMPILDDVLGQ